MAYDFIEKRVKTFLVLFWLYFIKMLSFNLRFLGCEVMIDYEKRKCNTLAHILKCVSTSLWFEWLINYETRS